MNRTCKHVIQALLAGTALTQAGPVAAGELPQGATTVYGGVAIANPSANQLTIQQSTTTAIVNWQGFSVGAGNRVDITQPSSTSALLNRVTGSAPSTIAGQINANGQVYLVNPNGIAITPTGTVRAGGFVASTLDISDQDFAAGRRTFRGGGQSAAVSNQGTIEIARGGYAALLGGRVDNSGTISVPMGRVGLGAGEQATLDLSGDGFLQVALPSQRDGSDAALIQNSGRISATGGRVILQAATARDAARNAINLSGVVEARSVSGRNGAIVLGGGEGGVVTITGRLDTSARGARQAAQRPARGGDITVTGNDIRLIGATLRADGRSGGGTIRVGGGFQGQGPLQRAATTTVDAATTISANAGQTGDGGNVVIWSDRATAFAGRISATGGALGGDGGQAEVSGKNLLAYSGTTILTAEKGAFGTLLLDPYNVTISNAPDGNQTNFAAAGENSVINATTLQNALRTANVTVTTGGAESPGTQAGDITVAAPLTWGTGTGGAATVLTLNAYHSIAVNANLTVSGDGGLALNTNQGGTGGTLSFGTGASASFTGGTTAASQTLRIDNQPYTLLSRADQLATFLASPASAGGRYALATNVDATGAVLANPINTSPTGTSIDFTGSFNGLGHTISNLTITSSNQYVGLFGVAQNATIESLNLTNLTINGNYGGTNASYVGGLVALTNNTTISGVSVSGTITNSASSSTSPVAATGGLVGSASGTVQRSSSSARVTGGFGGVSSTGGLIGANSATVSLSYATGNVTSNGAAAGYADAGGLIGTNGGAVSQSYATGNVVGGRSAATASAGDVGSGSFTGGLIGFNGGSSLTQSYATGTVTGGDGPTSNSYTGGLVGYGSSGINQAYATGRVTGGASANVFTGGLVGYSTGAATASFWDTATTGQTAASGNAPTLAGATGLTTAEFQNAATFVPLATAQGWNFQTVWAPPSAGVYPDLLGNPRSVTIVPGQDRATQASVVASASVTPNVTTILPNFSTAALSLTSTVDLTSGGGPTLGSGQGSQDSGGSQTRAGAQNTLASIQGGANALEARVAACDRNNNAGLRGKTTCYSDALDSFADTLEIQTQQLPPAFRSLPAVIRQAAQKVRAAKTVVEARAAVRVAVVAVRKAIALLRADEPAVARIQVRQGNVIASALRTVDNRLSRAVGL